MSNRMVMETEMCLSMHHACAAREKADIQAHCNEQW